MIASSPKWMPSQLPIPPSFMAKRRPGSQRLARAQPLRRAALTRRRLRRRRSFSPCRRTTRCLQTSMTQSSHFRRFRRFPSLLCSLRRQQRMRRASTSHTPLLCGSPLRERAVPKWSLSFLRRSTSSSRILSRTAASRCGATGMVSRLRARSCGSVRWLLSSRAPVLTLASMACPACSHPRELDVQLGGAHQLRCRRSRDHRWLDRPQRRHLAARHIILRRAID